MRVADVNAFYSGSGGGVRRYVDRKLASAARLGIDLTVIAPGEADMIETHGLRARVRWVRAPAFPLDRRYRYFDDESVVHAALDATAPDIVEASTPWSSASMVAAWPGPARRALMMHADPLSAYAYRWFGPIASTDAIDRGFDWYWRRLRRFDRAFDLIVSPSAGLAQRLRDGGLARVASVPLGLTDAFFSPSLRSDDLRRDLLAACDLGDDALLLIGIGRLSPEKRWPLVVDAVTAAAVKRPIGLVLIGAGRDRGRLVQRIGGNPHVRLLPETGDRPALARVIASADALVHGCEAETFCFVAAEARASGLPLIVPDRGGAADLADRPVDRQYRAASRESLTEAILATVGGPVPAPTPPRLLDAHFDELIGHYRDVCRTPRATAGSMRNAA